MEAGLEALDGRCFKKSLGSGIRILGGGDRDWSPWGWGQNLWGGLRTLGGGVSIARGAQMVCGRHRVPGSGRDAPPRPRGEWKGTRTVQRQRPPPKDARHRSPSERIPSLFLKVNPSSPSSRAPRDPGDCRAGGALELRGSGLPAGRGAGAQVSASNPGVGGHRPSNSA